MGLFRKAVVVVVVGIVIKFIISLRQAPALPANFGGHVEPGFEAVEKAFRKNFEDGFEPDGAAFAVCYQGKLVVDLWGGYSDSMAVRPWTKDTITTAFSTTKAVAAIVIAKLVDEGKLSYEDLVTKYWPEFGKHGKDKVTVKNLVSHQAGLAGLDHPLTIEDIRDWRKLSKIFEDQVPNWPLGKDIGYHALTFGWLCDQLVRRVDPKQRSLGQFFKEEIAQRFDIDFFIGIPREERFRVARMTTPSLWDLIIRLDDQFFAKFALQQMFNKANPLTTKVIFNPPWLDTSGGRFQFNNPDIQELEVAGANGIGSARALARLFCLLDGTQLISKKTFDKISQPVVIEQEDKVIGMNITSGWGFMFSKSPTGHLQLGHPGYGGQYAKFDSHERLSLAYLRNHMAPDIGEASRTVRNLQHALYESIKALKNKK